MAEKNRALEEAKAKAEQEKLFQEAQARRAAVAKADRAHLQALHARQEDKALGPIKAKKNSHALSRHTVKYLRISEDNRTSVSVWKSNFGRLTPSTRRCILKCACSMAWRDSTPSTRRCPRNRVCSMAWRLTKDNLAQWVIATQVYL